MPDEPKKSTAREVAEKLSDHFLATGQYTNAPTSRPVPRRIKVDELRSFVAESNRIEGIHRVLDSEVDATAAFLKLETVRVQDLSALVAVFAPGHRLRDKPGLNVRVGNYCPPPGGPLILSSLENLLYNVDCGSVTPFQAHLRYEALHPFTDGNGRSGRALWLWVMKGIAPLGFLHMFYYQTLAAIERRA